MKPILTVIIVHWNTPDLLKKQLQQLAISNQLQIIVVDNASDQPLNWLKQEFPMVKLITNDFNCGYAFACNRGALPATGEWLLFLNPDVQINQAQIIAMIDYAEKNRLVACSPAVGERYQKPLPSWLSLLIEFTPLKHLSKFIYPEQSRRINFHPVFTLFGGCLLIKKNVLYDLGGWDERFFLWFEDSDLTYRLLRKNYRFGFIPLAELHRGGVSAPAHQGGCSINLLDQQKQRDLFFHAMDVYAKKHFSWWGKLIVKIIKSRYSRRQLLPVINDNLDITVPNLKENLLADFFANNRSFLSREIHWIVVSSAIANTIWQWRRQYPQVRFIAIEKNFGFAATVNIGFRVSLGSWLGTVNDDVILNQNWLKNLSAGFNDKTVAAINPLIFNKNGQIESAGINILDKGKAQPIIPINLISLRAHRHSTINQATITKVAAVNAAAVIYSKPALNRVGLFDERFGSYLEDIDLSLRLTKAGYNNIVVNSAFVTHLGQQSSQQLGWYKHWLDLKNWHLVIIKNWGWKKILINLPAIVIERLRNLSGLIKAIIFHY